MVYSIGKRGEGPGEFLIKSPSVKITENEIQIVAINKFIRFNREGTLIKEKKFPYLFYDISAIGDNYVIKRNDLLDGFDSVCFVNQNLDTISQLYRKKINKKEMTNKEKSLVLPLVKFQRWKDKLYFTHTNDFSIEIYDKNGKLLNKIKKEITKNRITELDQIRLKNRLYRKAALRNKRHLKLFKQLKYTFPEYFPDIQDFTINNDRIYVKTYSFKENKEEYVIYSTTGEFLRKVYLPETDKSLCSFSNNKFYYLIYNEDDDVWVLHLEDTKM